MNNKNYEKGTISAEWKNDISGFKVDYSDLHGFSLYAFLQSPSEDDVKLMSENADLVIYFDDLDGVGFFTFNFSGTGGSSAFAPSLLLDYPTFDVPDLLGSYPFNIYVIDSSKGELIDKRSLSLGSDFSEWLCKWCRDNETLNLSLDSVKEISARYFDLLRRDDMRHNMRVAYSNTNKCRSNELNKERC